MTDNEPTLNPYAPTTSTEDGSYLDPLAAASEQDVKKLTLRRTAIRWLVVCIISAGPSFAFGLATTNGRVGGMITGILIFVIAYTLLDYTTATRPIRQKRTVRRTMRIAYGTRITISILFPIGIYLDAICGIVSIGMTQGLTGYDLSRSGEMGFLAATLTTLVQGVVLNLVLGCYALLVHGIQLMVIALRR